MRFLQPLLVATSALAASHVRRQAAAPTDLPQAFATIEADTTALNAATQAFAGDFCPLIAVTSTLLADIQAGIALAEASPELTIDQVIAIIGPTQTLATAVDTAVSSSIDKYDAFVAAGVARVVYNALLTQQTLSAQFSDAVVAALPEALQDAGRMNAAPIAASLARGVAAFADAPGSETPPSCGGSSSSSSTTTTSSSSTSSSSGGITPQPYPYPTGPASYPPSYVSPHPYPNSSPPPYHGSGKPPKYHSSGASPPSYGSHAPHPYPSKETHPPVYQTVTVHPSPPAYTKPHPTVQPSIQPAPPAYHPPKTDRPNASYPVQTVTVTPPKPYQPIGSFVPAPPLKQEAPKGSYAPAPPPQAPGQNPPAYASQPPAYTPRPSKTDFAPNSPSVTYSPPPEYTGGAVKAATGFGALAMAIAVVVL